MEGKQVESCQVSVVLSVYKNIESFEWTLKSILRQTGCSFEVIVIDDGNAKDDSDVLRMICGKYSNVQLYINEFNLGLTKSLIKGCHLATAPFIARIDNGDLMVPINRLSLQLSELRGSGFVVCGGGMDVIEIPSGGVYQINSSGSRIEIQGAASGSVKTLFPHVTVMFSKSAYLRCGGYDENLKVGQDTDLWPRILQQGQGVSIEIPFAVAPMWQESISVAKNNEQIKGKVSRLRSVARGKPPLFRVVLFFRIALEYLKSLIPSGLRNRLKLRKNYTFKGNVFRRHVGLPEIYSYYTSEDRG